MTMGLTPRGGRANAIGKAGPGDGKLPINPSGGLKAKESPIGFPLRLRTCTGPCSCWVRRPRAATNQDAKLCGHLQHGWRGGRGPASRCWSPPSKRRESRVEQRRACAVPINVQRRTQRRTLFGSIGLIAARSSLMNSSRIDFETPASTAFEQCLCRRPQRCARSFRYCPTTGQDPDAPRLTRITRCRPPQSAQDSCFSPVDVSICAR
jgi:hypothetical protein